MEEITADNIRNRVYTIRDQQVMFDYDLAEIYGYEVRALNQQVKRNIDRFPEDFMFQIKKEEMTEECLKSQIVTLNESGNKRGLHVKKLPYAFTEQGIYMLATVLRGELAKQQSIFIMRTFREMRHYIMQNQQFVTQSELGMVNAKVSEISAKIAGLEDKQKQTELRIDALNENFITEKDIKNFVIYKGQKFEADAAYVDIYQQAETSIYVVDDYMNTKTLQLISQKKSGVEVVLFTENGHGKKGFLTSAVVKDFQNQYPPLRIKSNPDCHDRWIINDYKLPTEQVYHCGASSKDAGKKLCAINKIENTAVIYPVIDGLLAGADKTI